MIERAFRWTGVVVVFGLAHCCRKFDGLIFNEHYANATIKKPRLVEILWFLSPTKADLQNNAFSLLPSEKILSHSTNVQKSSSSHIRSRSLSKFFLFYTPFRQFPPQTFLFFIFVFAKFFIDNACQICLTTREIYTYGELLVCQFTLVREKKKWHFDPIHSHTFCGTCTYIHASNHTYTFYLDRPVCHFSLGLSRVEEKKKKKTTPTITNSKKINNGAPPDTSYIYTTYI